MKYLRIIGIIWFLSRFCCAEAPSTIISDDQTQVTVLGYHDFSETLPETAMRIRTSKFRAQMQRIKDAKLQVISLDDFIAWKAGTKSLSEQCVLITIDDGWKSVYTDAYPILKEFQFPYVIYLYKEYVDGGGKALTSNMIKELMQHSAAIGCHSWSHPYPAAVKKQQKLGAATFDAFLRRQMGESKQFLESKFSVPVSTYAYPGGYHSEEMLTLANEFKYSHLFTVIPGKVRRSMANQTLPRYMILGNFDNIFESSICFTDSNRPAPTSSNPSVATKPLPYPVKPAVGSTTTEKFPTISIQLSSIPNLAPESLTMRVSGFGEVPATFDKETQLFSWKMNRALRQKHTQITVTWKDNTGKITAEPAQWMFNYESELFTLPSTH